jgi:CRP-like cAMP-binding protein
MKHEDKLTYLKGVSLFSELDDAALIEVAKQSKVHHYPANHRIVTELEFGEDVYVIVQGLAEVSVCPQSGERKVLGEIGPGTAFGEMASLTGELRSATVRSLTPVEVLVLPDQFFDRLGARRPEIAVSLLRALVRRLAETEQTLAELLSHDNKVPLDGRSESSRHALIILWRELVVNHHKELAFGALAAFVATLLLVRLAVFLSFKYDFAPREVLRIAYVSGFALVILCACSAILTFRPKWRRIITLAFGVGSALIVNELGVTLAFDIFYKDSTTPDPNLVFDIELLYRRTEPFRATLIGLAALLQAVYLKSFYRRAWHLLQIRVLRLLRGHHG